MPGVALDADVDPADPARIVIATDEGVFVSSNAGANWRQRDVLTGPAHLAWSHDGPLFRIEAGGAVRVSEDSGATWQRARQRRRVADDRDDRPAGTAVRARCGREIVRSSDGGRSFSRLTRLTT